MSHIPVRTVEASSLGRASDEFAQLCIAAELSENPHEFRIRLTLPGCDEKRISLRAAADAIAVEGTIEAVVTQGPEHILRSEFGTRRLHRVLELPEHIAPDSVKAHMHQGLLTIVATKAVKARVAGV